MVCGYALLHSENILRQRSISYPQLGYFFLQKGKDTRLEIGMSGSKELALLGKADDSYNGINPIRERTL